MSISNVYNSSSCISCKAIPGLSTTIFKINSFARSVSFLAALSFGYDNLATVSVLANIHIVLHVVDLSIFKFAAILSLLYPSPSFCQTICQHRSSLYPEDHVRSQEVISVMRVHENFKCNKSAKPCISKVFIYPKCLLLHVNTLRGMLTLS